MPLARIITEHAEEALELAIQLRSRGFEVETVAPSRVPESPADLEVQLDACDSREALARVLGTPDEDLHIFVAPGALDESHSAQATAFVPPPYKRPRLESSPKLVELPPPASTADADKHNDDLLVAPAVAPPARHAEPELVAPVPKRLQIEEVAVASIQAESLVDEPVDAEPVQPESVRAEPVEIAREPASEVHSALELQPHEAETRATLTVFESPEVPTLVTGLRELARASVPPTASASSRRSTDPLFWRTAIAAAALAVLVVVVGSAWQRSHPTAGTLPSAGAQQIPFQNAPVQKSPPASVSSAKPSAPSSSMTTPPAAVAAGGASPSSSSPAQAVSPSPPHPVAASPQVVSPSPNPQPHQVAAKKPPTKKKPAPAQHHAATHSGDSGLIAKDTVVYYNRKGPAAPSNPTPKP